MRANFLWITVAICILVVSVPAWGQYYGRGMGMGMYGGMMGMSPYGWGAGMYGGMGAQAPNMVVVKEGEAVYCAVYGDLIDYRVYTRYVPLDEVAGSFFDDGTHGDEVPGDGLPSNIVEHRDTYLGPFAIKYKNMIKKAIIDAIIGVMDGGSFALVEKARAQALAENIDQLKNAADRTAFESMLRDFTLDVLDRNLQQARSEDTKKLLDQAKRVVENKLLMDRVSDARVVRATASIRMQDPLEFYRIPVAAQSKASRLVHYDRVNSNLTEKVIDWTNNLYAQFIAPDGTPYDDETYRFRLDVSILQNQQGFGLGAGYGAGMYGAAGGPPRAACRDARPGRGIDRASLPGLRVA